MREGEEIVGVCVVGGLVQETQNISRAILDFKKQCAKSKLNHETFSNPQNK